MRLVSGSLSPSSVSDELLDRPPRVGGPRLKNQVRRVDFGDTDIWTNLLDQLERFGSYKAISPGTQIKQRSGVTCEVGLASPKSNIFA